MEDSITTVNLTGVGCDIRNFQNDISIIRKEGVCVFHPDKKT